MDTLGNNGEFPIDPKDGDFPIDPIEGWLVEQFLEQDIQAPDDEQRWPVEQFLEQDIQAPDDQERGLVEQFFEQDIQAPDDCILFFFKVHFKNKIYEELLHTVHQGDHQGAAANISAKKTPSEPAGGSTSAPKTIEIKVELRESLENKKSQYKFRVDPTDKVSILRVLLVNKNAQLPEGYLFAYRMTIVNEDKSFLDQGMVDVGVPKLDVLDVANFSPHMDSVSNFPPHMDSVSNFNEPD